MPPLVPVVVQGGKGKRTDRDMDRGWEKAKGGKKERKRDWDITCQVDYRMM